MYDENLEVSFLGDLMISKDISGTLADVSSYLNENDFYNSEAKKMYLAINHLVQSGEDVNPITLGSKGISINFVTRTAEVGLSAHRCKSEGKQIHLLSNKRGLYKVAQNAIKSLSEGVDIENIKTSVSDFLNKESGLVEDTTKRINEIVQPTLDSIFSIKENGGIAGTTTGFKSIDKMIGGLLPGSLTIIGARPAMGKTAFALNMAEGAARKTQKPVMVISLEMNNEMLVKRMFAKTGMIDAESIRDGNLSEQDVRSLTVASENLSKMPIWFDDTPIQSFSDIRSRVLQLQRRQGKLSMVVIDYLGLIETGNERNSNRVNEVSKISRGLKVLSKEANVPIVALAQLNRGVEMRTDKRPMLSDLRDSGSIEQDADNVAFLYRDDYYSSSEEKPNDDDISQVELIIAKNRNGKRGTANLAFDKKHNAMSDWSYDNKDW